ncbi:MAG TPA: transporter substrate-binding domain-containing protein [Isosphaeraceae bacterium]|nr:transporter substrate-binding domain-containing protein [Isosphaeraceae bacterium]
MRLPFRLGRSLEVCGTVLLFCAAAATHSSAAAAQDGIADSQSKILTVCAQPAAMPRTGKAPDGTPRGLDVAVAQLLARTLGRKIEFHWCASADCAWNCLREHRCDLALGQPRDSGPPRDVAWSVPYAGGQFGLVVRRDARGITSLADLLGKRIGIVTGTVALSEKDHTVARFKSSAELLDGFQASALDAAFLDADFAAWHLHEHPALPLRLVREYIPREHWNMALAVRSENGQLLVEINRALAQLAETGELRKAYSDLGVHFRPAFTDLDRKQAASNTWSRIQNRGEMVVSFDPANLPYSSAREDRPGFDVELARALAEQLHVKLRVEWIDVQHETAMGHLLQRECDLVMGAVFDPNAVDDDEELAQKVLYSRPYYGTGYVLVHRKDGPTVQSLSELTGAKSKRLGTEAGSVADYRLRQRGFLRQLFRNQLATLKALNDGAIDFAYLWANVGWMLHASPDFKLEILQGYLPEDHWNVAIAMRQGDDDFKQKVDAALTSLIGDGTVARMLTRYHMPDLRARSESKADKQGSAEGVIRHGVAERGREPQMQRVQSSRNAYEGLARIRSAGELVVGLDQNNLPFSAAHPVPAGLDYELAGLLAEQLGVSLRVYWAYSSHDSYPAHLASKKRCDVMLGVMPDDRFGQRVLYSRPYYFANYRLAVRSGEGAPVAEDTVAVEEGVAVRGLFQQKMQTYPSLEAILDAVASGRARAGYVISARGSWLAHERWPGKLLFLQPPDPVDRFPISAAVRKTDRDLKEAIDRAWDELDRSGRLAQVFARWHVPYDPVAHSETSRVPAR